MIHEIDTMLAPSLSFVADHSSHASDVLALHELAFGPGRFTRAAFKVREGVEHDRDLSFSAVEGGRLVGSVIQTRVTVGGHKGALLGPLAVLPDHEGRGIGRKLVYLAIEAAEAAGLDFVLLVGDAPYYRPLGFDPVGFGTVLFPAPVDPHRVLACCFGNLSARELGGTVKASIKAGR
ncbi:GNAT family N-acetyltransferase [Coralliovum pocilloporae]|uniref:GNAT family N-acetyltransferase n=1 Tax=Coralliovum pocilloporae TaxID=3066369 RepID=UPI003307932B